MTLRRRLYVQFGIAILPLVVLLGYQAFTRSDLPQRVGGALADYDVALAGSDGSHSHTAQACRNAERAKVSTSAADVTSSQSRTYSPRSPSQRAVST